MAKKKGVVWGVLMWIVGVIMVLAIVFGLISKTLVIPFLPVVITQIAGWTALVAMALAVLARVMKL